PALRPHSTNPAPAGFVLSGRAGLTLYPLQAFQWTAMENQHMAARHPEHLHGSKHTHDHTHDHDHASAHPPAAAALQAEDCCAGGACSSATAVPISTIGRAPSPPRAAAPGELLL